MKKTITNCAVLVILAAMFILLIPGIGNRIVNENKNDNVAIAFLYNNARNKVSPSTLSQTLDNYKSEGINTVAVMEEDLNALVSRGDVTCIKYQAVRHKYDDESMRLAAFIEERCPNVAYDSYVVIASRDDAKEMLAYTLPRKYSEDDYADVGAFEDLYIYILHNGRIEMWNYTFGYDQAIIKSLSEKGFDIALIHKVNNFSKQGYLEDIERLVKEYDIEYLNLKETGIVLGDDELIEENYKGLASIINENNMTLVVTENTNQLSNQKFHGYSYVFNQVMSENGTNKVLRSFETYDETQPSTPYYKRRVEQFLNSTIDRNARFMLVTEMAPKGFTYDECTLVTFEAAKEYKEKIESLGYRVNSEVTPFDYHVNTRLNYAACAAIMIMCVLLMFKMITGINSLGVNITAIILSVLSFGASYVLPQALLSLYPTVFCVVMSCIAMTSVLYLLKTGKDKRSYPLLLLQALATMLLVLFAGSIAMGTMLSGIDYYINNNIFRGIKLSLIIPVFYTALVYYFMFIKNSQTSIFDDVKKVFNAQIKVYWVIIAGIISGVGIYYIIRSGNVSEISGIEKTMRTAVTELFAARPRTKEFLIGYPALVLLVYYVKHVNVHLMKWLLAIATSILAASVTNSFCHVFTDYTTIVQRTLNGLLLGIIVSVFAYVANYVVLSVLRYFKRKFNL